MNTKQANRRNQKRYLGRNRQRGIALVFTLLLLTMMIALSLAMAIAIGSQTMIAGYYKNYRGAFYAADSGVNIMRQAMLNQLQSAVPATVTTGVAPIPSSTASTILSNIQTAYASWQPVNSSGSWPEQFELSSGTASFALTSCTPTWTGTGTGFTCASPPTTPNVLTGYQYVYTYSVTAIGQVQNSEQQSVTDSGNLLVNISVTPDTNTQTLFSAWGMFIDKANECDGTTLVPGTITGPVFTNGGFTFTPSTYIFTDNVGFGDSTAGYQFSDGTCNEVGANADSYGSPRTTIAPQFNGGAGLQLAQNTIAVPTNSINQEWAVLDGKGTAAGDSTTPTATQLHNNNMTNTATGGLYPTSGASTGVFLPITTNSANFPTGCAGPKCFTGGGIYVEGSANAVTLTASTVGGHSIQSFTIVQGTTTTLVQEDMTAGTTSFTTNGGSPTVVNNLPFNANNTPSTPATMVYVDGNIGAGNTGLSGPGSGNPAIQDNAQVTVTANGNLTITGDLLYKTEPVTLTQNQNVSYATSTCCNGDAADFLIPLPTSASTQVLGVYTANGNVQLNNQQSSGNLEIDASVAAFSAGGGGGLVNTGASIGTLNIVGGRIQSTIQNIGATTRNVYFDRRFAQGTFGPPWFPTATVRPINLSTTSTTTKAQRLQWLNNSATLN
jgi:Tfp pilus assembly protein PilX